MNYQQNETLIQLDLAYSVTFSPKLVLGSGGASRYLQAIYNTGSA